MGYRVAILHPGQAALRQSTPIESTRLGRVVEALRGVGIQVAGAPYADESVEEVRAQLLRADGVLVWVNPIEAGRDRSILNGLLEEVAEAGVLVSDHPNAIRKMGTKEVLYRTRSMSWGGDTRLYRPFRSLCEELQLGRASCRERVCQYVYFPVVAVPLK